MFNLLYKLSFGTRIWISFVLLIVIAILATGWGSFYIAADKLQENAIKMSQDTVNKAGQVFDEKLQKIAVSMMSLMMSDAFHDVMDDTHAANKSRYYTNLTGTQSIFSQLMFNEPIIHSVMVVTPIGDFYPMSKVRLSDYSFYETPLYENIKKNRRAIWVEGHEDRYFSGKERVLSLVIEGVNYLTYSSVNDVYILVNIQEKELQSLLKRNLSSSNGSIFVLSSSGVPVLEPDITDGIVSHLDLADLQRSLFQIDPDGKNENGYFEYDAGDGSYLVNYYRSQIVPDWIVYRMQSKDLLLGQVNAIKWTTITIMSLCALATLSLSSLLARLLIRPLSKLSKLMMRVETTEDLGVRYRSRYQDEVSKAGLAFNHMLDRIERLIGEIQLTERSKRKAEMKTLTAQINPHFFYNALHTVYCKSVLGENEQVNDMIIALSDMFRLGLNNGEDVTTLQFELDHVTKYLMIQQNCYEELFKYEIRVDPDVPLDCPVLKIMLQPLVENSIVHGFRDRNEGGKIDIRVKLQDQDLVLVVEDNGVGFDPKVLDQPSDKCSSLHGYALRNIRDRLSLFYDNRVQFTVNSRPGAGTTIDIRIPLDQEVGGHADRDSEIGRDR